VRYRRYTGEIQAGDPQNTRQGRAVDGCDLSGSRVGLLDRLVTAETRRRCGIIVVWGDVTRHTRRVLTHRLVRCLVSCVSCDVCVCVVCRMRVLCDVFSQERASRARFVSSRPPKPALLRDAGFIFCPPCGGGC